MFLYMPRMALLWALTCSAQAHSRMRSKLHTEGACRGQSSRDESAQTLEVSCQQVAERLIGDLLSTFILFSAKGISLLLPGRRIVPTGLYMLYHIYFNPLVCKANSIDIFVYAILGIFWKNT